MNAARINAAVRVLNKLTDPQALSFWRIHDQIRRGENVDGVRKATINKLLALGVLEYAGGDRGLRLTELGRDVIALGDLESFRDNPDLLLLSNPPKGREFGKQVIEVRYRHSANGKPYKHAFAKGVKMEGLSDGSVRLYHPSHRIWEDM